MIQAIAVRVKFLRVGLPVIRRLYSSSASPTARMTYLIDAGISRGTFASRSRLREVVLQMAKQSAISTAIP
jgi:hypothetical protein